MIPAPSSFDQNRFSLLKVSYPSPAAGDPFQIAFTFRDIRSVLHATWGLVNGPVVINRRTSAYITNTLGDVLYQFTSPTVTAANDISLYSLFAGSQFVAGLPNTSTELFPWPPDLFLTNLMFFNIIVLGLAPADRIMNPCITYKLWPSE